jgi:O-antigen/teichoic acid export membrane protein
MFFSFADKYCSLIINVVSVVILSRILTPAETGLYSVAAGLVNTAQTLRDFGVTNYLLQESELTRARLGTALGISLLMGCVVAAGFFLVSGAIADWFNEPRLESVVLVLSLNFVAVAVASVGMAKLHRAMDFQFMVRLGISTTLVHSVTSVTLAALGFGAIGLAWASFAGIMTTVIGTYISFPDDLFLIPTLKEWRRVTSFGLPAITGNMLNQIAQAAPDIIISRVLGFELAGLYSRGNGLITLFWKALMEAIMPVTTSALAKLYRERRDVRAPFLQYIGYTTALAWPLLTMIGFLAFPIIELALGDQWVAAVPVARFLCVAAGFSVLGVFSTMALMTTGNARRFLFVQSVGVPALVAALTVGAFQSFSGAAFGAVIAAFITATLSLDQVNRVIGTNWKQLFEVLSKSLLLAAATAAVPILVVSIHGIGRGAGWEPPIIAALGGGMSWLVCLVILRHPLRDELRQVLFDLKGAVISRGARMLADEPASEQRRGDPR